MEIKDHFQLLFEYHFGQLRQLLDLASELDEKKYHQSQGYGQGSLHNLLLHILSADRSWRIGIETGSRPELLDAELFQDLASLEQQLQHEAKAWVDLLEASNDSYLNADVTLTSGGGRELILPRVTILQHVILHGMQHLAEASERLSEFNQSPGNIDFIYFAMQQQGERK